MHIFIDTNIYLAFYESASDSLMELEKLTAVLKQKNETKLWLPDQVKREFWKNRDGSVADAFREFTKGSGLGAVPRLVAEDLEFGQLKKFSAQLESKKQEIVDRVRKEVALEKTQADKWVRELFGLAQEIDTAGELVRQARERALCHTPPGKQDGLGDRLSWVALLSKMPAKAELHIISNDGDYAGDLDKDEIHPYLKFEWEKKNGGSIKLWKRTSQFLANKFSDAKNAIEIERTLMIESLENSPNFATTHSVIAQYPNLSDLNQSLANRLGAAILNNPQVRWIHQDKDVKEFITTFLKMYGDAIVPESRASLENLLNPA